MGELTTEQINSFINNGFVKIENAFSTEIAADCRAILWKATQCDPNNPASWTQPVIRVGELGFEPFKKAANTPILRSAYDQLVGKDNWFPRLTLGSFPIRFPSKEQADDTGWHVDASFAGEDVTNYFEWRINIHSKGRGLLMLFLFSDVSEQDAPTILRVSSHFAVAKILRPEGEKGLSFLELANRLNTIPSREEVFATGKAGTVYLCHPFIVHAAQNHYGTTPKFMAQPPLLTKTDFNLNKIGTQTSPVEKAILTGLEM
ncbi:MAG TPA: phytanoyl-CoA dioxygenase [Cyclobacteriaceae bacterium]